MNDIAIGFILGIVYCSAIDYLAWKWATRKLTEGNK